MANTLWSLVICLLALSLMLVMASAVTGQPMSWLLMAFATPGLVAAFLLIVLALWKRPR